MDSPKPAAHDAKVVASSPPGLPPEAKRQRQEKGVPQAARAVPRSSKARARGANYRIVPTLAG